MCVVARNGQHLSSHVFCQAMCQTFSVCVNHFGNASNLGCRLRSGTGVVTSHQNVHITTDLRLNEPRYVTLPNIMKAKKKQLDTFKPEDLGVDVSPRITTLKVSEPPKRSAGIKVPDVATLVDKLKNVSKVI